MKYRVETRTRLVPHTVDGRKRLVNERYTAYVPVPPRDWDRIVLGAVTAVCAAVLLATVAWSTANVGALLDRTTTGAIAYTTAAAFDAAWIVCLGLEWLARYDRDRARRPRQAGHAALALAVAAVGTHGWLTGSWTIGVISGAVSVIAKLLWTLLLGHYAKPLDDLTQQWVEQERAEIGGQLALVAVRRELQRARGLVDAEARALAGEPVGPAVPDPDPPNPDADPDPDGNPDADSDPEREVVLPLRPTVRDAVTSAYASGITDPDRVLAYVRRVANPNAQLPTIERYLRDARRGA